jgi:hypothetical protein
MMVSSETTDGKETIVLYPEFVHVALSKIPLLNIIHEESVVGIPAGLKSISKNCLNQRVGLRSVKSHCLSAFHVGSGSEVDSQHLIELSTDHFIHLIVRILAIIAISGLHQQRLERYDIVYVILERIQHMS